jgi:hypothetical protein
VLFFKNLQTQQIWNSGFVSGAAHSGEGRHLNCLRLDVYMFLDMLCFSLKL